MLLETGTVELLAPAGTWETLEAAVNAGADAVYLGGKRFNMRLHRAQANFDDDQLAGAVKFAHSRGVKIYITVNNLLTDPELAQLYPFLQFLETIKPDALIIQDLSLLKTARDINLTIPLHASVMMNIHNEYAVRLLQNYGVRRIVASRELSLSQLALLRERTGIELEYFIHGDMCGSESGQCLYSGLLFGQSANRGRCLKPCRWPYRLVDTTTGRTMPDSDGPYKLAVKDMCLYLHLPELIQSGVTSFKIEGRMRPAGFIGRLVQAYRAAIDRYIADPTGYSLDMDDWHDLQDNRVRDFYTAFAFGEPGKTAIGYGGEREPRFFSQAINEPGLTYPLTNNKVLTKTRPTKPLLAVRVADPAAVQTAGQNGADIIYLGGEAFKPSLPWTLTAIAAAVKTAARYQAKIVIATPRTTMARECGELEQNITKFKETGAQGIMVGNIGALELVRQLTSLPVIADYSLNIFNQATLSWLAEQGISAATLSVEATLAQINDMAGYTVLPLEIIGHGPLAAMLLNYCLPRVAANTDRHTCRGNCRDSRYALLDATGQLHPVLVDQYCRNHLLFAKDLCLLPYLADLTAISRFRIEARTYNPVQVGQITGVYRRELDKLWSDGDQYRYQPAITAELAAINPRELSMGVFSQEISQ